MADEPRLPTVDPKVVRLLEDLARGIPRLGREEPLDKPPVIDGGYAAAIREMARLVVDERLRERHLLSEMEIKAVAKDIAHSIAESAVKDVKNVVRSQEQIEEIAEGIVVAKLRQVGLRADDEHIDETRQTVEGLQRNHKRRAEMGTDFIREVLKALAGYSVAGLVGVAGTYIVLKGGSH